MARSFVVNTIVVDKNQTAFKIKKGAVIEIGLTVSDGVVQNLEGILTEDLVVETCGMADALTFMITKAGPIDHKLPVPTAIPVQPNLKKSKAKPKPVSYFIGSSKTGELNGITKADISKILGFRNNATGDVDKVTSQWDFNYQGVDMSIWDYKGSARFKMWSTFGPPTLFKELFGDAYTATR